MALSDEDLLSAIKVLAQDFPFKEASECREWTDELASRCAERCAEKDAEPLSPDVCKAILQFVFSVAAPQAAEHRPLQWSCLELVAAAGRATARQEGAGSRADLHGFLFRLAKKEAKSQPVWKPRMLILMLQWVTRWIQVSGFGKVLEGLGEDAFDRKVVTSFAEALYGELGASDRWRPRWSFKASRSLCRLLHLCPLFAEHAAGWVAKKPEEAPAVLVAALGAESVAYPESFTGRGALVEAYAKGVLESKGAASDGNLAAWASVVAVVTPEEFEKQLLPLALRMTKRNPAATAASVPSMASHLRLDLSGQSRELLDPYGLELLKDKEKRPRGLRLVRSVAQGSRDACALLAVVEAWMESLKKAGKVDDKQAILLATATLADGLAPGACAGDAAEVVRRVLDAKGALVKCAGEDANEETRGLGYRAVGSLASQLPAAEREAAVKVLLKPLSDKKATDPVKLAAVSALVGIAQLAGEAPMPGSGAVLEGALPLVTVGATKPAQRFQSLLAWAACVRCSADDLAKALKKDHLVVLKDGSSFVNSVATILKAPAPELHAQAQLWGALLAGRVAGLLDPAAAAQGLAEKGSVLCIPPAPFAEALPTARSAVVLLACLHERGRGDGGQGAGAGRPSRPAESPAARAGLLEAAAGAGGFEPLLLLLAQALLAWLAELSQTPAKQRQVSNASLRDTLLDLCRAASRSSVAPRPETLALLALAAHHPMLSSRAWPAPKLWGHLCSAGPLAERVEQAPAALWQAVRTLVGAARALPAADSTGFRRAACALAGALDPGRAPAEGAKEWMHAEVTTLVGMCIESLHSEEVAKEKPKSVSIFFAPEGRLWMEEGTYVAEEREDLNQTNKVNKFLKGYEDEDLRIDRRPATSAAKSKAKATAKGKAAPKAGAASAKSVGEMTKSDIEAIQIEEQSETRKRIRTFVDECDFALDVLTLICKSTASATILEEVMPELVPRLMQLLASPLTVVHARRFLRQLVPLVVSTKVLPRRDLLPDALMVTGKGWFDKSPEEAGTRGEEPAVEAVLRSADLKTAMSSATLALVLPMILRALGTSRLAIQDVCCSALVVLEHQLSLGAEFPESMVGELFESLGMALLALPGQRDQTQGALCAVSRHVVSTEEQLARLAEMFFSDEEVVRQAVVVALADTQKNSLVEEGSLDPVAVHAVLRLGALDEKSQEVATQALEALCLEPDAVLVMDLIELVGKKASMGDEMHLLIAKAMAEVLGELEDADQVGTALELLTQLFRENADARLLVARCLEKVLAGGMDEEQVTKAFRFILVQALGLTGDGTPEAAALRDVLLAAGITLMEKHGEEHSDVLFGAVESFEDSGVGRAASESAKLGVAVFLGALSKHLPPDHEKLPEILPRLLQRLQEPTSTHSVQNAIVKVMPPLMKQDKEKATETLLHLLDVALEKKTDPMTRRGAAMGVGAAVKGLSIQAVGQHNILTRIKEATENKKDTGVREGALLCLEGLTLSLGRLFDPYVVTSLPLLLTAFSDPQRSVQAASQTAAKVMMSQLSGPGVKQVLKPLLEGIQDKQWKTKLGSIELLASMTSCLPKQLAACLPTVVPALCTVINDQHAKVKEAAREAIDKVGSIITSPELRAIAPELIHALTDGAQFEHITRDVLDKVLGTSFVHHIDAPSLSLVCPLVQRALKERSAEMKRKGAQIVGSLVLLIRDPKDIQPYLPLLLPQLKETLVDPIPDVRATAAKAFGTLANGLPEDMLGDVLPWLFEMLRSDESAVERSGAAHGLSEVLMAMGMDRIEMLLPDILANARNQDAAPEVREGYLGLFVYLPVAMGAGFEPYLEEVMQTLLKGIADDTGSVRDTGFQAAKVLTKHFGASHTAILLGPLQEGVFDTDWRIRQASVQLMGQLIEQILRANRIPTNSAELMHVEAIPKEWREYVLASLYIVRSDESPVVKQECQKVWKAFVQNPPRVLKELLPTLMTRLLANLASASVEKQKVAARCVGDLVAKLGERVMPELMPIFMDTLATGDEKAREGVCLGLEEVINATTKQLLQDYLANLIPAIQQAIIDEDENVRNSASRVVALLHGSVGPRATTDVVTWVLIQLLDEEEAEEHDKLLSGLEKLLEKSAPTVLPLVLSQLGQRGQDGWTKLQLQGLAALAVVPDTHTVHRHLSDVLPPIISAVSEDDGEDPELVEVALHAAGRVIDRVEQAGLHMLFAELVVPLNDKHDAKRRAFGARLVEHFFESSTTDVAGGLNEALPGILRSALADEDPEALSASMKALGTIVKKCKKEELVLYLEQVRDAVLSLLVDPNTNKVDPNKLLPGLCEHNGLEPLYPVYQQGLMNGTAEVREIAAKGLGELVNHTSEQALKPYVVKITGPLIRIVGDRFPGTVKRAIVDTLKALLTRGGANLKPFLPQLQTTYLRCLTDPSDEVKRKAAESLGILVRLAPRTEPLINDLNTTGGTHADPMVRLANCRALGEVLLNMPTPCSEAVQEKILDALLPKALGGDEGQHEREAAAFALAMLMRRHVAAERALGILSEHVEPALQSSDTAVRHGAATALAGLCWCQDPQLEAPPADMAASVRRLVAGALPGLLSDGDAEVKSAAVVLAAASARLHASMQEPVPEATGAAFAALVGSGTPSGVALRAARHYAAAAAAASGAVPAAGQLAVAVARRGTEKDCQVPEYAEQALASILVAREAGEEDVRKALASLTKPMDGQSAQLVNDYGKARVNVLAQYSGGGNFGWDF